MHRVMAARLPYREHALVDKEPFHIAFLFATVVAQVIDPTGVVDQLLERAAQFHAVMDFQPGGCGVVPPLGVAKPFAVVQNRKPVDGDVELVQQFWLDRIFQHQIAAQVE